MQVIYFLFALEKVQCLFELISVSFYSGRNQARGGPRGAFAPPTQAPKVRILILNIQVKECNRLN